MRKTRIFLGLLLIISLMAFVGCGINEDTTVDPDTPGNMTDNKDLVDDVDDAVDNAGDAVEDLVTTEGAVDKTDNGL